MDGKKLEKVTEKLHSVEANMTGLRHTFKKLPPIEKMIMDSELKTLQQQVAKPRTQQQ